MSRPGGSVILPTYGNWPQVERTLRAVAHDCGALAHPWEIIVVDNESAPGWAAAFSRVFGGDARIRLIRRTGLGGRHFQPGAARNIGIEAARHDWLVFLDSDCIPSSGLLGAYWRAAEAAPRTTFVGHRRFVESAPLDMATIVHRRAALADCPPVPSRSNYGYHLDRRLPELWRLSTHERPYNCFYSCNFALHRDCIGDLRFNPIFDGHWGYEDIELGYRLHQAGRTFVYLPDAIVYHQENPLISSLSCSEKLRNFRIAAALIPGFFEYRMRSSRAGAFPDQLRIWEDAPPGLAVGRAVSHAD